MNKNHKRVVLITGASSGIGQACANHLHQKGYQVYGTSRQAQPQATAISEAEDVNPTAFEMIQMDVDDDSSVARGVEFIWDKEGRLDVVVNCAGFGLAGSVEDTTIEVERIIETPSPRLRYPVGPVSERVAITLKKVLPSRFFEWGLMKYYKLL